MRGKLFNKTNMRFMLKYRVVYGNNVTFFFKLIKTVIVTVQNAFYVIVSNKRGTNMAMA
jgi:hypothetical protein